MTNTQLEALLAEEPEDIQAEIIRINTDARPLALQVALLVPLIAAVLGLLNSLRMMRLPDPQPSSTAAEGRGLGLTNTRHGASRHATRTLTLVVGGSSSCAPPRTPRHGS